MIWIPYLFQEMYNDDDLSKQMREGLETRAMINGTSDEIKVGDLDDNPVIYNGSTVLSFYSDT